MRLVTAVMLGARRAERFDALLDAPPGGDAPIDSATATMLRVAASLRRVRAGPAPAAGFSSQLRDRLVLAAAETPHQRAPLSTPVRERPRAFARPALAGAVACAVVAVGVAAAVGALPGDPLLGIGHKADQAQAGTASAQVDQAAVHLALARQRLNAANAILNSGRPNRRPLTQVENQKVESLLTEWRTEAGTASTMLLTAARDGSTQASAALTTFTAEQTQAFDQIYPALPTGALRALATQAITFMGDVNVRLGARPPRTSGVPLPTPTGIPAGATTQPLPTSAPTAGAPLGGTPGSAPATVTSTPPDAGSPPSPTGSPADPSVTPTADPGATRGQATRDAG